MRKHPGWSILGVLFYIGVLNSIGTSGYAAMVLGLVATAAGIAALFRGGVRLRTAALVVSASGIFVAAVGFSSGRERSQEKEAAQAAADAARLQEQQHAKQHADAAARLVALPQTATSAEVLAACETTRRLGDIPKESAVRCGDAFVAEGTDSLAHGKPLLAKDYFEQAVRLGASKENLAQASDLLLQASFRSQADELKATLVTVKAKAAEEAWEEADADLKKGEASLKQFANSSVARQRDWTALQAQAAQLRRRVQAGLDRLRTLRAKEQALLAIRGPKPENSAWDGSVHEVEQFLKRVMNDADSYEHVGSSSPVGQGNFWVVRSTFRGKNAFGGKVLNTKLFYIQQGQVVSVVDVD